MSPVREANNNNQETGAMGMNAFSAKVLALQSQGFDFVENKRPYKRESRMIRHREESEHYDICIVTLWDDDTVTDACHKVPATSIHAGFVQR